MNLKENKEKERTRELLKDFFKRMQLIAQDEGQNANIAIIGSLKGNCPLMAWINVEKPSFYVTFGEEIINEVKYQSLKELNDIELENLDENRLLNYLIECYNNYNVNGSSTNKDKQKEKEFLSAIYKDQKLERSASSNKSR